LSPNIEAMSRRGVKGEYSAGDGIGLSLARELAELSGMKVEISDLEDRITVTYCIFLCVGGVINTRGRPRPRLLVTRCKCSS